MKTRKLLIYQVAAIFLGSIMLTGACKKSPVDDVKLIIDFSMIKTQVGVTMLDAKTGEQIKTGNPNVKIEGRDKNLVMDISGRDNIKVVDGLASLTLRSAANPNTASPIRFTVIGKADGYLSTSQSLTVNEHGSYSVVLRLVKLDNLPPGVSGNIGSTDIVTANNGAVLQEVTVTAPVVITTGTSASLTIREGTVITDANGNPLSGTINTTFVYFTNQDDEAMQSFPGGFNNTVIMNDGSEADVTFFTAGFIAITMTDNSGLSAKYFDPPLELYMEIPAETTNHEDDLIEQGMEIPLWSYEESTGVWQQEPENAVVQQSSRGVFYTMFEVDHLSWWNLDWFINSCYIGATVIINSTGCSADNSVYLELRRENGQYLSSYYQWLSPGANQIDFMWVPQNTPAILYIKPDYFSEPFASLFIDDLCEGTYTIDVELITNLVPVHATFVGLCPDNPNIEFRPSAYGWYRKANDWWWHSAIVWNGEVTICLEQNTWYVFGTVFDGVWYDYDFYIDQTDYLFEMEMTDDFCDDF